MAAPGEAACWLAGAPGLLIAIGAPRDGATLAVDGRAIAVIGRDALVAAKRAAGRPRDLADVEALTSGRSS